MRSSCPLWYCLESAVQAKLMMYQWDNYGKKLKITASPGASQGVSFSVEQEGLEEIDRIMRQAPNPKRLGLWDASGRRNRRTRSRG